MAQKLGALSENQGNFGDKDGRKVEEITHWKVGMERMRKDFKSFMTSGFQSPMTCKDNGRRIDDSISWYRVLVSSVRRGTRWGEGAPGKRLYQETLR